MTTPRNPERGAHGAPLDQSTSRPLPERSARNPERGPHGHVLGKTDVQHDVDETHVEQTGAVADLPGTISDVDLEEAEANRLSGGYVDEPASGYAIREQR